jgi:poly-gamma-glutamate capsule biosynthesis protein CapA/YwtB (metallophosphatase superfamily)
MSPRNAIIFSCGVIATATVALWWQSLPTPEINVPSSAVPLAQLEIVENDNLDFLRFRSEKEKLPQASGEASFIAVGDIMLSRDVDSKMKVHGYDYPWEKVREIIAGADISFGNLETAITPGRKVATNEMVFRADPENAQILADVGFDVLSLANNHSMNFGATGMEDTIKYLEEAGVQTSGAGKEELAYAPVYIDKNNIRFAFLSFQSPAFVPQSYKASADRLGVAFIDEKKMIASVTEAKQSADIVIVSMHAGVEYTALPNTRQVEFSRAAIDAGADMVIGHHPHVTQTMEKYKGKYIFYSLGNFVFDQMWSRETRRGLMIKVDFNREGVQKIELVPVLINDYSQPQIIEGSEQDDVLARLRADVLDWTSYYWENGFQKKYSKVIYNPEIQKNYNVTKIRVRDLDNDKALEIYALQNGVLTVQENLTRVWQSDENWWVDDFEIADSNNDESLEINMSVWRPGNFGEDMPAWEQENDMSIKNHFFVYQFNETGMRPLWQSSNLDAPNCEFEFFDIDKDSKLELIVIEGEYQDDHRCLGKHVAVWEWREWGFYNDWRSEEGITDLRK